MDVLEYFDLLETSAIWDSIIMKKRNVKKNKKKGKEERKRKKKKKRKEKKKKTPNGPAIPKGDHRKLNVSSENEAFSSQTSINTGPNSC